MKHGSLFSGIGGFDLAAQWMGWDNVFHCEFNDNNNKILKKNFPKSISYGDIKKQSQSLFAMIMRAVMRVLISPAILFLLIVTYFRGMIIHFYGYIRYGGEWYTYTKTDRHTVGEIYKELLQFNSEYVTPTNINNKI